MKDRNIALIGFRATGKSAVGKILAQKLGRTFIDMDLALVSEAGQEIAAWVAAEGWDSFRKAESALLQAICMQQGVVVATGGGVILDPQNREALRKEFFTIWLKAGPKTIHRRLEADPLSSQMRPALSNLPILEEIQEVLSKREQFYLKSSDIEVDTEGKEPLEIAEGIIEALKAVPAKD